MENKLSKLLSNFQPQGQQEEYDYKIFLKAADEPESLTRKALAHFTASAFVLNERHDKILAIFHKIYQSWGWLGGHADGNSDLLAVAIREVQEESGLNELKPLLNGQPISIEDITVPAHVHRTRGYVSAHLHLNVTFLLEASENEALKLNEAETAGLAWIPIEDFVAKSSEPEMRVIYQKIIDRIKAPA